MFNQSAVRLRRSLAFSTEDSTILLRVATALLNSTSPSLGPISIMPQPSGPTKLNLRTLKTSACRMATGLWDSSYQDLLELVDLPTLECRWLETRLCLLYKIINKLCYFDDGTFTVSTSLSHHAPHNLVLNRPFARTVISILLFLKPSSTGFVYRLCFFFLFMPFILTCTFYFTKFSLWIMSSISHCCYIDVPLSLMTKLL